MKSAEFESNSYGDTNIKLRSMRAHVKAAQDIERDLLGLTTSPIGKDGSRLVDAMDKHVDAARIIIRDF